MTLAYVGLGSNLDHPRRQLARAVRALRAAAAHARGRVSPTYLTAPRGVPRRSPTT